VLDIDSIAMSHSIVTCNNFLLEQNHYHSPWVEPGKSTALRHPTTRSLKHIQSVSIATKKATWHETAENPKKDNKDEPILNKRTNN
jgi:hypothetical protein